MDHPELAGGGLVFCHDVDNDDTDIDGFCCSYFRLTTKRALMAVHRSDWSRAQHGDDNCPIVLSTRAIGSTVTRDNQAYRPEAHKLGQDGLVPKSGREVDASGTRPNSEHVHVT